VFFLIFRGDLTAECAEIAEKSEEQSVSSMALCFSAISAHSAVKFSFVIKDVSRRIEKIVTWGGEDSYVPDVTHPFSTCTIRVNRKLKCLDANRTDYPLMYRDQGFRLLEPIYSSYPIESKAPVVIL